MPELPEVESVRRSLAARVLGCTVTGVVVRRREVVVTPDDPPGGFSRQRSPRWGRPRRVPKPGLLVGAAIASIERHGKQLAIVGTRDGQDAGVLLVHLGMTGEIMAPGPGGRLRAAAHVHVLWTLRRSDGAPAGRLAFRDPRRFGGIWTLPSRESLAQRWADLGPDGISITGHALRSRLHGSARPIKAALLDQRTVAGVGNIYADEALFLARLHPARRCDMIDPAGYEALAEAIRRVLARAIELGGSTIRDYRDARGLVGQAAREHRVYGRAGLPCSVCSRTLVAGTVAQRTTVWCPRCQPATG
ncbi:MAG: bifunctional DNA-formamidopyrimidine glycosylase/DNA-(apurinic or apyrimidinic site) lyase [Phycisphaerales bacterium]